MTADEKRRITQGDYEYPDAPQANGKWYAFNFAEGGSTLGKTKGEVERNVDWLRDHPAEWDAYQRRLKDG